MRAVAHRGVPTPADECLLWGEERTWRGLVSMSANDPNRTLGGQRSRPSLTIERRLRSTLLEAARDNLKLLGAHRLSASLLIGRQSPRIETAHSRYFP